MATDVIPALAISDVIISGTIKLMDNVTQNNGTANVTISNVAPAGVTTATISAWMIVKNSAGTIFYIPMWT